MYKIIMAPTEGSDNEREALTVAVKLAQRFNSDLHLVRVHAAPLVIGNVIPRVLELAEQALREERLAGLRKLEALGTECQALAEIRATTALLEGPVAPTLRDYARKLGVDLIVMSSHARGGIKRIALGSVSDYLIRHTNIPVLVVKRGASFFAATPEETVSRIVVPLDGSALAEQILPDVAKLALRLNATVSLVKVLTPQTYSQRQITQAGLPWWDEDIAFAEASLARAATYLTEEGVAVNQDVILSDNVPSAILDYAARTRADLIAIATRGNGGVNRFLLGTVADEVVRRARVSLLVFHPAIEIFDNKIPVPSEARVVTGV